MSAQISLDVKGIDKVIANLDKFKKEIKDTMKAAGKEVSDMIVKTEGLKKYPAKSEANSPGRTKDVYFPTSNKTATFRVGYYARSQGWMQPTRGGGYKQLANSQRYGTHWTTKADAYGVKIANATSYAQYLGGDNQVSWAGERGWRKLAEVGKEKAGQAVKIYQAWVDRLVQKLGL